MKNFEYVEDNYDEVSVSPEEFESFLAIWGKKTPYEEETQKEKEARFRLNFYLLNRLFVVASLICTKVQWQVFVMTHIFQLTQKDIARQLSLSQARISQALDDAYVQIRKHVNKPDYRTISRDWGVSQSSPTRWKAVYRDVVRNKNVYLGTFKSEQEARQAYLIGKNLLEKKNNGDTSKL